MSTKLKLNSSWFVGVENKPEHEAMIKNALNGPVLKQLVHILKKNYNESEFPHYNESNWAYRQAHLNGKRQALAYVLELLNEDPNTNE